MGFPPAHGCSKEGGCGTEETAGCAAGHASHNELGKEESRVCWGGESVWVVEKRKSRVCCGEMGEQSVVGYRERDSDLLQREAVVCYIERQ